MFREVFATNRRDMNSFTGIRFKKDTAKRFQNFSRQHFKSHTEALETMLDFFQDNEISPKEKLGPSAKTLETKLLKRINAVIAIMRDMEKSQTKPTLAMLESLFQAENQPHKPSKPTLIVEKIIKEKNKNN